MSDGPRVRFAPSPTGHLHIGGARTALFNWLYARRQKGVFVLRIEDTDEVRSTEESVGAIYDGLRWLGLEWDEGPGVGGGYGPYTQMERRDLYDEVTEKLLADGHAYWCYCSAEELRARREEAMARGRPPGYDGRCRDLSDAQRAQHEAEGRTRVLRFRVPDEGDVTVHDVVRGECVFEPAALDDFVIVKSSGAPMFNLANVVDDHHMEISHVIRGDDHLSNTPRQLLIYRAMGWRPPKFAHAPMILDADGQKLSKRRTGAETYVAEFRAAGYLPSAMLNYLALLGWSTPDSRQLFESVDDLIKAFSIKRITKNPAIFDRDKLDWLNGQHVRLWDAKDFVDAAVAFLPAEMVGGRDESWVRRVVALEQERVVKLSDIGALTAMFFEDELRMDPAAWEKEMTVEGVAAILRAAREKLAEVGEWTAGETEVAVRAAAADMGVKGGAVIHPVRVAATGRTAGPGLFDCLGLLGEAKVLARLDAAMSRLAEDGR